MIIRINRDGNEMEARNKENRLKRVVLRKQKPPHAPLVRFDVRFHEIITNADKCRRQKIRRICRGRGSERNAGGAQRSGKTRSLCAAGLMCRPCAVYHRYAYIKCAAKSRVTLPQLCLNGKITRILHYVTTSLIPETNDEILDIDRNGYRTRKRKRQREKGDDAGVERQLFLLRS